MELFDKIKRETIIVCNNNNKKILLRELNHYNKLFPIKFILLNELYNLLAFKYNEKTLYSVISKYNVKYDVAKVYLDNLKYITDQEYNNPKLDKLVEIKKYLDSNNLLIKDKFFLDFIKDKDIIFYGFDYIDKFTNQAITELKKYANVEIMLKKYSTNYHSVIEFNHIEEEVEYVASSICKLINQKININDIKITNINEEYYPAIKRIFNMYNIPVNLDDNCNIASTLIGKDFIQHYDNNLNQRIEFLNNKYHDEIINQIISIVNKYTFEEDKLKVKDMIVHELFNTKVKKNKLDNCVEIIDYNDIINDNEYVFMMNFNQGIIPKIMKDEEYLTNKEKSILNLDTSTELSKKIKLSTIKNIDSIKNLIITYKLESYTNSYFPSNLIQDMSLKVEHKSIEINYSSLANKIRLCKDLDKYYKYNIKSTELLKLYSNYSIPYRKYSNKFNGIKIESLNSLIKDKLYLSYSSMQSYNECSFKYYVKNILRLDTYEEVFSAFIGTLFHHILEVGIKSDINVTKEVLNFIENKNLDAKEKFFVNKLINDMEFVLNTIKSYSKYTLFNDIKTENKLEINKRDNISVTFNGFIDKIMFYNDGTRTYVVLIDYKTYDTDINMDLIDYGLNIQLPVYLYLVNGCLKNVEFAGFYVQRILSTEIKYDIHKSLYDQKRDSMKLVGYSNNDEKIIKLFDNNYKDSQLIKGMKLKNDGNFMSSAKVLSTKQIKQIISKVDNVIDVCVNNIKEAKFDINPKNYKDTNISCEYCKYKDICFVSSQDEVNIVVEEGEGHD